MVPGHHDLVFLFKVLPLYWDHYGGYPYSASPVPAGPGFWLHRTDTQMLIGLEYCYICEDTQTEDMNQHKLEDHFWYFCFI